MNILPLIKDFLNDFNKNFENNWTEFLNAPIKIVMVYLVFQLSNLYNIKKNI